MENFPYLCMIFSPYFCVIFPIPANGNTRVNGKFPSTNEKSLYVYRKFKSMEEKPYFRMGYLRLFFTVCILFDSSKVCLSLLTVRIKSSHS